MISEQTFRSIAIAIALMGVWLIIRSTDLGLEAQSAVLSRVGILSGEPMIRASYEGPIAAYRTIGAVLLGVGLFHGLRPWCVDGKQDANRKADGQ